MTEEHQQVANLPRLFFTGGIPGKLFLESEPIADDGFLLAKPADALGAVALSEAALFTAAHRRVGDDEADQTVVNTDGAALQSFGQPPSGALVAGKDAAAKSIARVVGQAQRVRRVLDLDDRDHGS